MNANTNNSNVKTVVDTWYVNNMTAYTNKLEDTIYCNDRSLSAENPNYWTYEGVKPNYNYSSTIKNGALGRSLQSEQNPEKNHPTFSCINKNDSFTVNDTIKGNGALTYPVGLITADELFFAGALAGTSGKTYTNNYATYWTMTPKSFNISGGAYIFINVYDFLSDASSNARWGLRPVISIKQGQLITKGTGTVDDPYVIE